MTKCEEMTKYDFPPSHHPTIQQEILGGCVCERRIPHMAKCEEMTKYDFPPSHNLTIPLEIFGGGCV